MKSKQRLEGLVSKLTDIYDVRIALTHEDDEGEIENLIYAEDRLTENVANFLIGEGLEYWRFDKTPHNRAEEGFVDKAHSISFIFPLEPEGRIVLWPKLRLR